MDTAKPWRIGDYIIHRALGDGGMGRVFEAEEHLSKRRVALKILRDELAASEAGRRRFIAEMTILARLDSPHIVRCLHCTEVDGQLLIALEYLDGHTLRARLQQASPGGLPWLEVVAIALQIVRALAAAHANVPPIIHRDLKPENIMVLADGHVKVLDFGIAKMIGECQSQSTTHSVGTLQYMSPEHIDAQTLDPRADLFSLGLVVWEMLVGHPPFRSDSPRELLDMLCTRPTPKLPAQVPPIPVEIEQLVEQLLAKRPEDRPASAAEVLARLESSATTAPASASAGSPEFSVTNSPAPLEKSNSPQSQFDTVAIVARASEGRHAWTRIAGIMVAVVFALAGSAAYWVSNTSDERPSPTPVVEPGDPPTQKSNSPREAVISGIEPPPSSDPPTTLAEAENPTVEARVFADLLPARESSAEQAEIVATFSHKAGFKALDQEDHHGAFKHFARAAANDLVHWKHPYNMACASARAGDMEDEARLSLEAAIVRDPDATRAKARRELDFDSIRHTQWFRALID